MSKDQTRMNYRITRKSKGKWVLTSTPRDYVGASTELSTYPSRAMAYCVACLMLGRGDTLVVIK